MRPVDRGSEVTEDYSCGTGGQLRALRRPVELVHMNAGEPTRPASGHAAAEFIVKAGLLAAVLATVVSALLIVVLSAATPPERDTTSPSVFEMAKTAILLCPITAVSCGPFGLLSGLLGSALLSLRKRRIRSIRRLLIEAGIVGFVLGFFFPFFDRLVSQSYANGFQMLLSAPAGTLCALFCAVLFRHRFLTRPDAATAQLRVG